MTFFNRALLLASAALVLAACDGRQDANVSTATFKVTSLSMDPPQVVQYDVTNNPSVKKYSFKACLQDVASNSALPPTIKFSISDGTNQQISYIQDSSGCLLWQETHDISNFQKARTLRLVRTLEGLGVYKGKTQVLFALNPWTDSFSDWNHLPPDADSQVTDLSFNSGLQSLGVGAAITSTTFMNQLTMSWFGHNKAMTKIDSLLGLQLAENFTLSFTPQLQRRDSMNQLQNVSLKGGQFNISIAFVPDDGALNFDAATITNMDLIAGYNGVVDVRAGDGTVLSQVPLNIYQPEAALSRARIIIILIPTGVIATMVNPGVYTGHVSAIAGAASISAQLLTATGNPNTISQVVSKLFVQAGKAAPTGTQFLASKMGPANPDVGVSMLNDVDKPDTDADREGMMKEICGYFYKGMPDMNVPAGTRGILKPFWSKTASVQELCDRVPEDMVALAAHEFVESVSSVSHVDEMSTDTGVITLGRSISFSGSDSDVAGKDHSTKYGWDAGVTAGINGSAGANVGIGYPPKGAKTSGPFTAGASAGASASAQAEVTASIGTSWYHVHSTSQSQSTSVSGSMVDAQQISAVQDTYNVNAVVRRCIVATPKISGSSKNGIYVCEKTAKAKPIRETYYLVSHSLQDSLFGDSASLSPLNLRLLIRGPSTFQKFRAMMMENNTVLQRQELRPQPNMTQMLIDYPQIVPEMRTTQEFPGMVSE